MIGAIRAKIHSNPWSIVPATAYSGLEKSHSRYEPPIDASAIRTSVVAAAIAMQRACSTRRLDSCARANWSFSTSSFSESACRPPRRGCGNDLARQRAHRGVEYLSDGDEHLSVGHREPALPFGYRLPYHVQLECELLLREALLFPEGLDVLVQHGESFLSPDFYVTAMLPADGPLPQATGCNVREDCLISQGVQAGKDPN